MRYFFFYGLGSVAYVLGIVIVHAIFDKRLGKAPSPDLVLIASALWPIAIIELICVSIYWLLGWSLGHGEGTPVRKRAQSLQIECRRCGASTSRLGFFCRHCGAAIKRRRRRRRPQTPLEHEGARQ